jgi:hypothetical protein
MKWEWLVNKAGEIFTPKHRKLTVKILKNLMEY